MNGAWNSLDEKRKDKEYAENEKYYRRMQEEKKELELKKSIDEFVVSKDSINIDGFDDRFIKTLLVEIDDIDNITENGRSKNIDFEALDIDSKVNHRKHAMLLSNNNNRLKILLIDGSNNLYSHLSMSQENDKIVVFVNTYENGELFKYNFTAKDSKIYLSFGERFSKDNFKKLFSASPNSPRVEEVMPYLENDASTLGTHGEKIDRSEYVNFENALIFATLLFNKGIRKYITSKTDGMGEQYLTFDDSLIEQDLSELYEQQRQSSR